jgi:hypothetical protein
MRQRAFGVGAVLPSGGILIHWLRSLREEEKGNTEEYTDGRSGDDPDREEVKEDTDRKRTRCTSRCRCSSGQGRQQRFGPGIGEHGRRRAERIDEVHWIGEAPRNKLGLYAHLRRQLFDQRVHQNLSNHLSHHSLRARHATGAAR